MRCWYPLLYIYILAKWSTTNPTNMWSRINQQPKYIVTWNRHPNGSQYGFSQYVNLIPKWNMAFSLLNLSILNSNIKIWIMCILALYNTYLFMKSYWTQHDNLQLLLYLPNIPISQKLIIFLITKTFESASELKQFGLFCCYLNQISMFHNLDLTTFPCL